jgi:protease I
MAFPTDSRVLVLAADGVEDMELMYPLHRLREEGVQVTLATLGGSPVTGKRGHGPVEADAATDDVQATDYDALVIPGGYAPDKLRRDTTVLQLVRAFDDSRKPIAFICHAGWVPISAGLLEGRRATSVRAIRDDMVNAGVDWVDEETVVDGNLISARVPSDLGPWMQALLKALRSGNDNDGAPDRSEREEAAEDAAASVAEGDHDPVTRREAVELRLQEEDLSEEGSEIGQHNP